MDKELLTDEEIQQIKSKAYQVYISENRRDLEILVAQAQIAKMKKEGYIKLPDAREKIAEMVDGDCWECNFKRDKCGDGNAPCQYQLDLADSIIKFLRGE